MPKLVCFTKDRPMQFRAFLESLFFYIGGIEEDDIHIITDRHNEDYNDIFKDFRWCYKHYEIGHDSFDTTIKELICGGIELDNHNILFCVDDVIWFKPFNSYICDELNNHEDVLGMSLRLGTNTTHKGYLHSWNESKDPRFLKFDWRNKPSHYGYPFEITASVYHGKLLKEIVNSNPNPFRVPNDLESWGMNYCLRHEINSHPKTLIMNSTSYCAAADLNRVQSLYENPTNGDPQNHSAENLLKLYRDGYRIDWKNYYGIEPDDCFIGQQRLRIVK